MGWAKRLRARALVIMLQATYLTLPLGGCLLNGDKPDPALDIPVSYNGVSPKPAVAEAALPPLDWWRAFRSRELSAIVEEARANNLDPAIVAGVIRQDPKVKDAIRRQTSLLLRHPNCLAAQDVEKLARTCGIGSGRSE